MVVQAPTTHLLDKLRTGLSAKFPPAKVEEVLFHYIALRREARLDHYDACLVNGGKFVEAVLKCLHYLASGTDVDSVVVDSEIRQLESVTALGDSARLTIPRTLRVIYEHRNKRGGAHNSSFNPLKMDCVFVVAASSWVMEELARLYLTNDSDAAQVIVANLLVKEIPFVEEIEGDYLVLKPGSARMQLEILLYHHYPNRCSLGDLKRWLHNHTANNISTTLRAMKLKNLAHEAETGWRLTEIGVREAEIELAALQGQSNEYQASRIKKVRVKGTKRGRR